MLPTKFNSIDDIKRKLETVAKIQNIENVKIICHIFYDLLKVAYYSLERKKAGITGNKSNITLKRKEITRIIKLMDYFHKNDDVYKVQHELTQCFGANFHEQDALRFFEEYVEGVIEDKYGRTINIDLEEGTKFMYKDKQTGRHVIDTANYQSIRGKRLPWIKHTIKNTKNVFTRKDDDYRELMYICRYELPQYDEEVNDCYWAVIVKRKAKDKIAPYGFKTAFSIIKYNSLLKRLEKYEPIEYIKNI